MLSKPAAPQPLPPVPLPFKSSQDGASQGSAQLAQAAAGGFQSTNPTGGLGVPNVLTSTAKLLGL